MYMRMYVYAYVRMMNKFDKNKKTLNSVIILSAREFEIILKAYSLLYVTQSVSWDVFSISEYAV